MSASVHVIVGYHLLRAVCWLVALAIGLVGLALVARRRS